jgi:energy-coupling factor transporter ATP-binding protein EcfA2
MLLPGGAGLRYSEKLTLVRIFRQLKKGKVASFWVERDMDLVMGCIERTAVFDRGKIIAAGAFDREACAQYAVHGGPQNLTAIPVGGSRITPAFRQSTLRAWRNVSTRRWGANLKS